MAITSTEFNWLKGVLLQHSKLLKNINGGGGGGDASEAKQDEIITELEREGWTNTAGNSQEFVYYAVDEPGNPSNNTDNIKQILYKVGAVTTLTKTFTYDNNNNVLTITTS